MLYYLFYYYLLMRFPKGCQKSLVSGSPLPKGPLSLPKWRVFYIIGGITKK